MSEESRLVLPLLVLSVAGLIILFAGISWQVWALAVLMVVFANGVWEGLKRRRRPTAEQNQKWFLRNLESLIEQYSNQVLAVANREVVANASTIELLDAILGIGEAPKGLFIARAAENYYLDAIG